MKKILKLVICVILLAATGIFGAMKGCFTDFFTAGLHFNLRSVLTAVISVLALLVIEQVISLILGAVKPKNHRVRTVLTIIVSILKYAFGIIALCAVLAAFGADIRTVVAGVGILALVIGFGAESLIADVITGLFSIMENQYNVGDIVEVNGFRGTISNIGIRTTSITDAGGNILIINNSNMKNVLNRSDNKSRAVCTFPIPYEADLKKLEGQIPSLMQAIYEAHPDIMTSVPTYIGIDELADSSVNLKFTVEVEEKNIHTAIRIMNHDLLLGMKSLGIEPPYPHMDIHSN